MITDYHNFIELEYNTPTGYKVSILKVASATGLIEKFNLDFFNDRGIDFSKVSHMNFRMWQDEYGYSQEDCFRLLPYRTKTNNIACIVSNENNIPIHMSFCNIINNYMRIGIGFNTVSAYRNKLLVPMWRKDWGYLNHLLNVNVKGHFVTFHGRNKKLQALIKMVKQNRGMSGFLGQPPSHFADFKAYAEEKIYSNVPQLLAYRDISGLTTEANYKIFLNEIL